MVSIGERIRDERKKLQLSQADFAKLAGCSRNAQAIYERNESLPGAAYLIKLSEMGIDVQYVLIGQRTPSADGAFAESEEEKKLLENYRAMDEAARLNIQAVGNAFAQSKPQIKTGDD